MEGVKSGKSYINSITVEIEVLLTKQLIEIKSQNELLNLESHLKQKSKI